MLLREMNHRVKNLFALTGAVVTLSAKSSASVEQLTEAVQNRLGALARAQELTLADIENDKAATPTLLHALVRTIVSPYEDAPGRRLSLSGPNLAIEGHAVTALALVFHEFSTNSAKYGALSIPDGRIEITAAIEGDQLRLDWEERGGPPIAASPEADGFGTWLTDSTIKDQFKGDLIRHWHGEGLGIGITIPLSHLGS
jgi:two-component sensor histidine kinase